MEPGNSYFFYFGSRVLRKPFTHRRGLWLPIRVGAVALALLISISSPGLADDPYPNPGTYTFVHDEAVFAYYFDTNGKRIQIELLKYGDQRLDFNRIILEVGSVAACPPDMPFCCMVMGRCKCCKGPGKDFKLGDVGVRLPLVTCPKN